MGEKVNGEAVRLQLKLKLRPSPPPPAAAAPPAPLRRRRNSIATSVVVQPLPPAAAAAAKPTPAHSLSFPNGTAADAPPPPLDLSGHAFASYTSLKDILPAVSSPAGSPTASASAAAAAAAAASSSYEISIRNRLVNRAAWAYLRPMSASPGSDGPHLLRRLWLRLSACLGFVFDRIVRFFSPLRPGR